jgi:hypothetical protein
LSRHFTFIENLYPDRIHTIVFDPVVDIGNARSNPSKKDIRGFDSFKRCFPLEKCHTGLVICSFESPRMISEKGLNHTAEPG